MLLLSQLEMQSICALIIGLCECCSDKNEVVTHSTGGRKRETVTKESEQGHKEEGEMKGNARGREN